MKSTNFLRIDFISTVKLTQKESREIERILKSFDQLVFHLVKIGLLKLRPKSLEVSLLLCGDTKMRALNDQYRKKDKTTDVLSFPSYENLRSQTKIDEASLYLGDIAISFPVLKKQAKKFKIRLSDEFIHLFLHGLIHLCGYDHEISDAEEKLMQKWEKIALDFYQKKRLP